MPWSVVALRWLRRASLATSEVAISKEGKGALMALVGFEDKVATWAR